jgi:hypothetical protein
MSLSSVVDQFNHVREQKGDVLIDLHDLQPDDADEVFYYIDDALTETGYVRGNQAKTVGFGPSNEDEHVTYLSAVVDLLQSGYDTPQYISNF